MDGATVKKVLPSQRAFIAAIILSGLLGPTAVEQAVSGGIKADDDVTVERDGAQGTIQVRITARDGRIAWRDVLKALLRVEQLNDEALQHRLPSGTLDLNRFSSRFAILGINAALGPDIRMQIVSASTDIEDVHLLVTIDRGALRDKRRRAGKKIRATIAHRQTGRNGETYGLSLTEGWHAVGADKPLVIVVHGFNSSPRQFNPLVLALQKDGFPSGTYSYPDDQPIADSARQLSADLKKLASEYPELRVSLLTHSMGGLVARAAVEDPELDPGNVKKLIMVAPPNHGTLLAHFTFGLDILDHALPRSQRSEVSRFYAAVADGFNEAAADLRPGSQFLHKLNGRPRNSSIRYSIFLGSGGRLTQQQLDSLREELKAAEQASAAAALFTPKLDAILADLDEVLVGKGDGVVAIKRGRLEGVDDTVELDFTHLGGLQKEEQLAGHELYEAVLTRLRK